MRRSRAIVCRTALCLASILAGSAAAQPTVGLIAHEEGSFAGYTLMSPAQTEATYLIDNGGLLVNSWTASAPPGLMGYLNDEGHLVRATRFNPPPSNFQGGAGVGGRIEEYDWDGNLVWLFEYSTQDHVAHHDIEPLPNGNVLLIAWEHRTQAEAIQAGRDPAQLNGDLWPDTIVEIEPDGPTGGNVVWEWRVWDHLIQNFNAALDDYGVVAEHPERIDVNYMIGPNPDWQHGNAVDYNAELDQIVVSVHNFGEFWVIDHSTTTAEAAGHTGGNSGMGGDLLYRWGNPRAYGRGTTNDQQLYGQHDAQWIEADRPGAGNFLVFNNGVNQPGDDLSSVLEIVPPLEPDGSYALTAGQPFGPASPTWRYPEVPDPGFYSRIISGAQRQPNGTTLICEGDNGHLFEVTDDEQVVWEYVSPVSPNGVLTQGENPNNANVFKVRRYAADFVGFDGRDLTPGDPIENFDAPLPPQDGTLTAGRADATGSVLEIAWDANACQSFDYNLLAGPLSAVSSHAISETVCDIGVTGSLTWSGVPGESLFFLVVGTDATRVYESSWGADGHGIERHGTAASFACGTTTKVVSSSCP
ncbi:MAG: hypothetical protein GY716_02180 [bacterium]|nr:hypothetical protein [bacterium]